MSPCSDTTKQKQLVGNLDFMLKAPYRGFIFRADQIRCRTHLQSCYKTNIAGKKACAEFF